MFAQKRRNTLHLNDFDFCEEYLSRVSRTFAVNIQILDGNVYKAVLLAYLLCRIADTMEDDATFLSEYKQKKLNDFASLFDCKEHCLDKIDHYLDDVVFEEISDDTILFLNMKRVFREFYKLPEELVSQVSSKVKEMSIGMASFQDYVKGTEVRFLKDQKELEQYCYYVAGTVGLMLTDIFSASSRRITNSTKKKLLKNSVAFGLGLQLTNIAKDFLIDKNRGWSYVPRTFFEEEGIDPDIVSFEDNKDAYIKVHQRLINLAIENLDRAFEYTLTIPRTLIKIRLFCLWPLFMALESLALLYGDNLLFAGYGAKISRDDVARIVRNTSIAVLSNTALKILYNKTRKKLN